MNYSEVIQFPWNAQAKKGATILFLKMNILQKYASPPFIETIDNHECYLFEYDNASSYDRAKKTIDEFIGLIKIYGLFSESPYHGSHLLYILLDYAMNKNSAIELEKTKYKLYNRAYLLRNLMNLEDFKDYEVTITGKLNNEFKYKFSADPSLKNETLKYLISKAKKEVKGFDLRIYDLIIAGATESKLKEAIEIQTLHKLKKTGIEKLVKKILIYLNVETQALGNPNHQDSLSVTNEQGDFIYDLLTLFKIYKPKGAGNSKAVKHHDTIRKIIKRSAKETEDN